LADPIKFGFTVVGERPQLLLFEESMPNQEIHISRVNAAWWNVMLIQFSGYGKRFG
jgi:hypothetical protein